LLRRLLFESSFLTTPKLSGLLALYFWRNPQKHKKRFETSNDHFL
jgi:hypothetical protein